VQQFRSRQPGHAHSPTGAEAGATANLGVESGAGGRGTRSAGGSALTCCKPLSHELLGCRQWSDAA
jgi:hypothetical protein